jgi:Pyruvate/2-oxoacid:ferredoxin oxidoreductase delta subunit
MDVARTARRLGAEEAIVVYRRTRDRMPAHDFEVEEALEEGVLVKWLSTLKQAVKSRLVLERMELDESGFPLPTGELEELEADSLVLAPGQETEFQHPARPGVIRFDELNPWYYSDAPRMLRPKLDRVRRQSTFDEVVSGLDDETAKFEARPCLSCGNCFACDNCYGVCPDNAVTKLDYPDPPAPYRYEIDLDFCKGCGLCAEECPCGAIEMEPEQI